MRSLSGCLLVLLVFGVSGAQPFGRFGYSKFPTVPGIIVDSSGVKARNGASDRLRFAAELKLVKATDVNPVSASYFVQSGAYGPDRIRANLLAPGIEFHFPHGFRFQLSSIQAPYLSWSEASVEAGVPTASTRWCLVSFRDSQPPILLAFPGGECAVKVSGRTGEWRIESTSLFKGWIRVALPFGVVGRPTNGVAELGRQTQAIRKEERFWTQPAPKLLETRAHAEPERVQCTWRFDRSDVIVPPLYALARRAGSHLSILSNYRSLDAPTDEGPLYVSNEPRIAVEFPCVGIPSGRAMISNAPMEARFTPPPQDNFKLAIENCLVSCSLATREEALSRTRKFIAESPQFIEPNSGQKFPFSDDGSGLIATAEMALVYQSNLLANALDAQTNPLAASLQWRRDWWTGSIFGVSTDVARTAAALMSIAGTMSRTPEQRVSGALFEAGLFAQEGLAQWGRLKGILEETKRKVDPYASIRRALYSSAFREKSELVTMLRSQFRVVGEPRVEIVRDAKGFLMRWIATEPGRIHLITPSTVRLQALKNITKLTAVEALGTTLIDYEPTAPGSCEALLYLPTDLSNLPNYSPPEYMGDATY